jgi:hypothetical protein
MILSRRGRTFQVGDVQLLVRMEKTMVFERISSGRDPSAEGRELPEERDLPAEGRV